MIKILVIYFFCTILIFSENTEKDESRNKIGLSFSHGRGKGSNENNYFYVENSSWADGSGAFNFTPLIKQPTGSLLDSIQTKHTSLMMNFYLGKYFFFGFGFLFSDQSFKQDKNILYTYWLYQINQNNPINYLQIFINDHIFNDRILQTNYSSILKIPLQFGYMYEYENLFVSIKLNFSGRGRRGPSGNFTFISLPFGFSISNRKYYFFFEPYYGIHTSDNSYAVLTKNYGDMIDSGVFLGTEVQFP